MNNYQRVQKTLKLHDLYPTQQNVCACGCGKTLTGKQKRWASNECRQSVYVPFAILKGDTTVIRKLLFEIDNGFCRYCGVHSNTWEADHIIPVFKGGGACGLNNYQTLCLNCHKAKHKA